MRDNAYCIVIFNQDDVNVYHIYNDHVGKGTTFNGFKEMCALCLKNLFLQSSKLSPKDGIERSLITSYNWLRYFRKGQMAQRH